MMASLFIAIVLLAFSLFAAVLAAVPLFRTVGSAIDCWANSVQGEEPGVHP